MNSDFFLAQRILRGDEEALRSFYEAHFGRVYHFVLIRVSGDHHQAEEIVQDTFLAGLRAMERFLGESSLYSWLCGIAKH
ncbi:MAG: RNA polymerase sigma factor, partial [Deltaproteobacteria bacterium]|nr:RNA polymerase sigma factor [Deltaproteobacteria bacterium]